MKVLLDKDDIWAGRRFSLYLGTPNQVDFIVGYRHDERKNVYGLIDTRDGMFTDVDFQKEGVAEHLNKNGAYLPSEVLPPRNK